MSKKSKIEYLQTIRIRYFKSSKEGKKKILDDPPRRTVWYVSIIESMQ